MKKLFSLCFAPCLLLFVLMGCAKTEPEIVQSIPVTPAVGSNNQQLTVKTTDVIHDLTRPTDLRSRFSYTYGYMLYTTMVQQQGFEDLDPSYFAKGVLDSGKGSGFFTQDEMTRTLYEVQIQLLRIAQEELEAIAQKNLEKAEEFLKANKERENVQTTQSGLQYQVLVEGEGLKPSELSMVEIDYTIMLLNGMVIDSSQERGQSSTFQLQAVRVPGFIEGVKLMQVGSKYRFWIHPNLAYGKDGSQAVEANSLLIVEVELKAVN